MTRKTEFDFTLILTGITPETAGVEDRLFAAGCDDATLAFRCGRPVLTFSRKAASAMDAIVTAIEDVRKSGIGADVLRVDNCNLVTLSEIARRIDRQRQVVHQYMRGQRGPGGFPAPMCELGPSHWLWRWCDVAYWLWENDMLKKDSLNESREVEIINSILEMEALKKQDAKLTQEIVRKIGTICEPCR
jgi:hypothetical protein